jgi:hypothetical protein
MSYENTVERRDQLRISYNPCVAVSGNLQGGTQVPDAGEHSAEPGKGESRKTHNEGPSKLQASGGQNDARYAYFPQSQRLAILHNGKITLYNTLDHHIGGVQQQQEVTPALYRSVASTEPSALTLCHW